MPVKSPYVVYYDLRFPSSWCPRDLSIKIVNYFSKRGFLEVNADELKEWMNTIIDEKIKDTIVIFSQDIIPDSVAHECSPNTLICKFLNFGGRAIWIGDIPFYYQGHRNGLYDTWGSKGQTIFLGIESFPIRIKLPINITSQGKSWGLTQKWEGTRPINSSSVKTILADSILSIPVEKEVEPNKIRLANAWMISGFKRLWDHDLNNLPRIERRIEDLYRITTHPIFDRYYWEYEDKIKNIKYSLEKLSSSFSELEKLGYNINIQPLPLPSMVYKIIIQSPIDTLTGQVEKSVEILFGYFLDDVKSKLGSFVKIFVINEDIQKLLNKIITTTIYFSLDYVQQADIRRPLYEALIREDRRQMFELLEQYPAEHEALKGAIERYSEGGSDSFRQCLDSCRNTIENILKQRSGSKKWKNGLSKIISSKNGRKIVKQIYSFLSARGVHGDTIPSPGDTGLGLKLTEDIILWILKKSKEEHMVGCQTTVSSPEQG